MTKCGNSNFWWTLSILQAMMIVTSHLITMVEAGAGVGGGGSSDDEDVETNFAFGGAMSGGNHRTFYCDEDMEFFQYLVLPFFGDCATFSDSTFAPYHSAGLIAPGLSQQVDFAIDAMGDSDSDSDSDDEEEEDVFFVLVGANDFFGAPPCYYTEDEDTSCNPPPEYTTQSEDYEMYTGAWTVKNIATDVERMYNELGARHIIVANFREPCAYQEWFDGGNSLAPVCRLRGVLPDDFVDRTWEYSRLWADQVNAGLAKLVDDFNQDHSDASAIFADFETKIVDRFVEDSEWEFQTTCKDEYEGDYTANNDGVGTNCFNHCFLDNDHFTSEFIEELVEEVVPEIMDDLPSSIRRLIAFGDSLVDNGSWADTQERAGVEVDTQSEPYVGSGSASNKYTFSEWLEIKLDIDPTAEPFLQ